jgi:hypothetical protein
MDKIENYLKINDLVTFDFLNPELIKIKDDFDNKKGIFSDNYDAKGLKVRIAATHAGIVTRNNMFYLPNSLKKGASTFLQDYYKPVLLHHDEKKDAIGRVIDSFYVDTSKMIRDSFQGTSIKDTSGKELKVTDELIRDFCNDSNF